MPIQLRLPSRSILAKLSKFAKASLWKCDLSKANIACSLMQIRNKLAHVYEEINSIRVKLKT